MEYTYSCHVVFCLLHYSVGKIETFKHLKKCGLKDQRGGQGQICTVMSVYFNRTLTLTLVVFVCQLRFEKS